jgi:hypothetical protein
MTRAVLNLTLLPEHRHLRFVLPAVVLAALLLLPLAAAAHTEGVMQLAAVPAGPYDLTVWTSPDPVTTAEPLHVAIAVVMADDAAPVLEADVEVYLMPDDGGPAISGPATIENSDNKFLHEAILDVENSGNYLVEISVRGADGGAGQVSFPLLVESGGGPNWTLIIAAVIVVVGAGILVFRGRRNPELADEPSGAPVEPVKPVDESPAVK